LSTLSGVFDVLICVGLLGLAWRAVTASDLFHSIVLFMVFGLLMAVTWGRLGSPDLALAEAALGAGITGALLLNACRGVLSDRTRRGAAAEPAPAGWLPAPALLLLCIVFGIGLAVLMVQVMAPPDVTASVASTAADAHALGNPVTAVLLDFRAYDTLLEMVVLLLAFLGIMVLVSAQRLPDLHPNAPIYAPLLGPLLAVATPVLLMTGLYLYQAGSHAPGGAFQAGALIAAVGVLHRLTGRVVPTDVTGAGQRLLVTAGLALFAVIACAALLWSPVPLRYPDGAGYALILVIEFVLMVSIAITLVLLFAIAPGLRRWRPP
jgi:multisubunit Na+/H+ antiporter MnhB subunit